jgi:hypothetical protein
MTTFRDIIAQWPSLGDFAADLGVSYNTAKQMRFRNSIAPFHWPALVEAAERRGISGVTLDVIARLHVEAFA